MRASLVLPFPRTQRPRRTRLHAPDGPPGQRQDGARARGGQGAAPSVLRILVVDDDPLMTDLLPRKLQRALLSPQPEVLTARTPEEGLALAAEARPDVVLSDFNLRATRDGLDVLDEVRRVHPTAVRILFSAHTADEVGPRLRSADIHGFVEKTLRLDDLVDPLIDVIRRATGLPLERRPPGSG